RLVKLTGNKNIAREAGRYVASPDSVGVMRLYVLGLIGPAKAYEILGKYAHNFTKSSIYKSKEIDTNKIEITVTPLEGVSEKLFQCENRMGFFEAIATAFNYRLPKIEHPECLFKGKNACRYIVSWEESPTFFWKKIRNYTAVFFSAACLGSYFMYPWATLTMFLPCSSFALLLLTLYAGITEKRELNAAIDNLRTSSDKLVEQVNVNYNNALMIHEIGLAISNQMDIDGILSNVVQVLKKRLDYDRGLILLANQDKTILTFNAGFGYADEQLITLQNTRFHLDRSESKGVFVVSFRKQTPFLINDITDIERTLSPHSLEFAQKMGTKSFVCCPIIYENESLGVLAADNVKTKKPLLQSDISLLMGIASEIGISIHNAALFDAKERQFKSILQVLAASIDARDSLTAGHSEKVTEYALGICHELGMPKNYCEMIRVASLLHDYGKIGIKDSILMKPGKLDIEERKEIETHVEKTKEILEQIHFEGIYKEIPAIAGSHHEKINGSGYPKGLKEEEIPLGAKIIAVADFFEAITSKRHYRDPMPLDIAFKLLKEESAVRLDRKVVEAFIRYFNRECTGK
ncbi:MAG TPA: HD domain-containing phosphohydrolase, partial [Candidatus Brocadiaceae bacterium]